MYSDIMKTGEEGKFYRYTMEAVESRENEEAGFRVLRRISYGKLSQKLWDSIQQKKQNIKGP